MLEQIAFQMFQKYNETTKKKFKSLKRDKRFDIVINLRMQHSKYIGNSSFIEEHNCLNE